jgi:hypothetical protein
VTLDPEIEEGWRLIPGQAVVFDGRELVSVVQLEGLPFNENCEGKLTTTFASVAFEAELAQTTPERGVFAESLSSRIYAWLNSVVA